MINFIDNEINETVKLIDYYKARPLDNNNNKYSINKLYKELKFLIIERDKTWKSLLSRS